MMRKRRNLIGDVGHCLGYWAALRRYPGVFGLADAMLNMSAIALPRRFSHAAAGRALAREARIEPFAGQAHQVTVLRNGLVFYWLGPVDNNLHYVIDQEFNPRFPHCYTTPPIRLTPQSLILDVGACEGLFAFRVLKEGGARQVICFEPATRTADYLRLGAAKNGLSSQIVVETLAVGRSSGRVNFTNLDSPDGNRVVAAGATAGVQSVECVSLDDYCAAKGLVLTQGDLLKVDAEGSDLDVLLGAERLIRRGSPQIAVTTYHQAQHVFQMLDWLKNIQPAYCLRVKGFASWTPKPVPVLLQAAL